MLRLQILAAMALALLPEATLPPPLVQASTTGNCSESGTTTITVTCTQGSGTWTPPSGLTSASFDVEGGHGGSGNTDAGGAGGKVTGTFTVSSANTYTILV